MNVLFVCTGNTCRSVMAEALLRRAAAARGWSDWSARSAGLSAMPGAAIPAEVNAVLSARGIASVDHRPQRVSAELVEWADLVLAMTHAHAEALRRSFPSAGGKIRLFLDAAGLGARDVADPIGQDADVYARCRDEIERGLESLLKRHAPSTASRRS